MEARIEDIVGGKRLSDRVVAVISGSEIKEEGVEWSAQAKSTYI